MKKVNKKERRAMERAGKDGVCLYGIAPRGVADKFETKGIENSDVYLLNYNDLTLIVSNAPLKEYDPTNEENVKAHREVALSVLQDSSLLPVAFGMVFKNKKVILNTTRKVYPLLKKALLAVKDKVELGVKVVLPKNFNLIEGGGPKSREGFLQEIEAEFLKKLESIAASSKKGKLFSARLALNASFLVDKEKIDKFSGEVRSLEKKHPDLKIQYSGPWPAYNFVDIKIMSKPGGG